jgi:hypothetical protein
MEVRLILNRNIPSGYYFPEDRKFRNLVMIIKMSQFYAWGDINVKW